MATQFSNMVNAGFKEARTAFGTDFTVTGASGTFKGVMRDTDSLLNLDSGGFTADYAGALEYLPDEVTIAVGGKVTINSIVYRVDKIDCGEGDPAGLAYLSGVNK